MRNPYRAASDVSEYNVAANLYELRAGAPWKRASSDPDAADAINAWMPDEGLAPGDGGGDGTGANAWEGSDGAAFAAAWRSLTIRVVGPTDFEKTFASRAKHAGAFDAIVVGAWKAQMVTPALGALARPDGGVLALEGSEYFVAADKKATADFAAKAAALARDAGFEAVASAKTEGDAAKEEEGAEGAGILPGVDAAHRFFIRGAPGKE
jgi:dynein assembly factor 3